MEQKIKQNQMMISDDGAMGDGFDGDLGRELKMQDY